MHVLRMGLITNGWLILKLWRTFVTTNNGVSGSAGLGFSLIVSLSALLLVCSGCSRTAHMRCPLDAQQPKTSRNPTYNRDGATKEEAGEQTLKLQDVTRVSVLSTLRVLEAASMLTSNDVLL